MTVAPDVLRRAGIERIYRIHEVADPAAGAEWSVDVPGDDVWLVHTVSFRLVTSGAGGNRLPRLIADDGTIDWLTLAARNQQGVSASRTYTFVEGYGESYAIVDLDTSMLPAGGVLLQPGWGLRTVTNGIESGDQYSRVRLAITEAGARGLASEIAYELFRLLERARIGAGASVEELV